MAQQFAGVFSGLIALPSVPAMSLLRNHTGTTPSGSLAVPDEAVRSQGGTQLYQSLSAFYDTLTTQDARRSLTGLTPATQNNIRLLQSVMQSAVVLAQAQTAGNLLTIAVAQAGVPAPVPSPGLALVPALTLLRRCRYSRVPATSGRSVTRSASPLTLRCWRFPARGSPVPRWRYVRPVWRWLRI